MDLCRLPRSFLLDFLLGLTAKARPLMEIAPDAGLARESQPLQGRTLSQIVQNATRPAPRVFKPHTEDAIGHQQVKLTQ
jgi:hypothetical protein